MTVFFGKQPNRIFRFSGPVPLSTWSPPATDGVYAICVPDQGWNPLPVRPIYFGQSEDLKGRGFPRQHHAYRRWMFQVPSEAELLAAWLAMLGSPKQGRMALEEYLIRIYDPPCNKAPHPDPWKAASSHASLVARNDKVPPLGGLLDRPAAVGRVAPPLLGLGSFLRPPINVPTTFPSLGLGFSSGDHSGRKAAEKIGDLLWPRRGLF